MRRRDVVHHGRVRARAFVLAPGVLGEAEARRRVLDAWGPGTTVQDLGADGWLLDLPGGVTVDTELAIGLPLVEADNRLTGAPGLEPAERLGYWRAGEPVARPATGTPLDPADWIDVSGLLPIRLAPVVAAPVISTVEAPPVARPVDLRREAGVAKRARRSIEIERSFAAVGPPGAARKRPTGVVTGTTRPARPGLAASLSSLFAGLTMRTPAAWLVRRRQVAYLRHLLELFDEDLGEALHQALPLAGLGRTTGARTLAMPKRRDRLEFTRTGFHRSSSISVGESAMDGLRRLYRDAAGRLEREGRIEEAAFTHVELLGDVHEGVLLLERHRMFDLAARIATEHRLDPALQVRLWWLSGARDVAIAVARRRGAFAAAIGRLQAVDPEAARELRVAWVASLEGAGDPLAAIRAGWPDPWVRPLLRNAVDRGMGLGGLPRAALLAYRLELNPSPDEVAETLAFLTDHAERSPELALAFAEAFLDTRPAPELDRQVASALRRALALAPPARQAKEVAKLDEALGRRADRLLVTDLPRLRPGRAAPDPGSVLTVPPILPGLQPVFDAMPTFSSRTLVALGEAGCRLIAADGRTVASWDTPAHRLVAADHGASALLLAWRGDLVHVTVLDLATRRLRPYGPLRSPGYVEGFDGSTWITIDERGIAVLDMLADRPTVSWRELGPGFRCVAITRGPDQVAAIVEVRLNQRTTQLERWLWSLPDLYLRQRTAIAPPDGEIVDWRILANGWLVWRMADARLLVTPVGSRVLDRIDPPDVLLTSRNVVAVAAPSGTDAMRLRVRPVAGLAPLRATIELGRDGIGLRAAGSTVTAWDGSGRVITADLASQLVVAAFAVGM